MAQTSTPYNTARTGQGADAPARVWKVAGYTRLSHTGSAPGSSPRTQAQRMQEAQSPHSAPARDCSEASPSVQLQARQIRDFVAQHSDMHLVQVFSDDGWSGSSFARPGFRQLEQALAQGRVDCVVVKDLSRFGRNYLEVGRYIDRLFPLQGTRLVALNDGFDSQYMPQGIDGMMVPLRNLANDYHCSVTSAKTRAGLAARRDRGVNVCPQAPYGYRKHPQTGTFEPDPHTAPVVRALFSLRLAGLGASGIAAHLNAEGVPTPQQAKGLQRRACAERAPLPHPKQSACSAGKWTARTVNRILANEVYAGVLVQGRRFKPSFRSTVVANAPAGTVVRVDGAHEAIVSRQTFDQVARLRKGGQ